MSSEWQLYQLDELCEFINGFAFKSTDYVDSSAETVEVLRMGYISRGGGFKEDSTPVFIPRKYGRNLDKYFLNPSDVVIAMTDMKDKVAILGNTAWISHADRFVLNQRVGCIRVKRPDLLNPRFFYFYSNSRPHITYLRTRANSGVQVNLSTSAIKESMIQIPPLPDQIFIADLLGALDDRITLLRETNATLEAIAQALFKSWFVDFDPVHTKTKGFEPEGMDAATAALFPDSFEESELGLVPSGWRMATLAECCERVESGGTPKRTVPEYWGGNVPWLTSGEVRNPIVFDTKEKISDLGVRNSSAKLWPKGTTVVAMYGATAGEVCLLAESSTANQACCALIPKSYSRAFIFMCVRREREALASKSSGSAQQNLNKGLVSNHPVLLAHTGVLNAYEDLVGSMLDGWIENERQSQTLTQLRDTLLPRLISGQLRLAEAEANVENALSEAI